MKQNVLRQVITVIKKNIIDKEIVKIIVVPKRIVSIVVR